MSCEQTAVSDLESLPDDIVRQIDRLDPLPVTAQKLLSMINGEDVSLRLLADLIETDQAIAAQVMRTAYTARYSGFGAPDSVGEAISRIGVTGVLDVVMEGYLGRLRVAAPIYDLSEREQWRHSTASRLAVRALAAERPKVRIPPIAETAALLHDVGKLVISRMPCGVALDVVGEARSRGITFLEAERDLIGVDHTAVGAALATHWQFPGAITEAIRSHHDPLTDNASVVLTSVAIANIVAKTIGAGLGGEGLNLSVDPGWFRSIGLEANGYGRVCLQTQAWLEELEAAAP